VHVQERLGTPLDSIPRGALQGVLFTDLDGTLLDPISYRASPVAIELIREVGAAGVMIIPASSKTIAELMLLREVVQLVSYAILENGSVLWGRNACEPKILGKSQQALRAALDDLVDAGIELLSFSQLDPSGVSDLTGLSREQASAAKQRLASEPFVFTKETPRVVAKACALAHASGHELVRGGRLWHIQACGCHKGHAVRMVLRELLGAVTVRSGAVGDAHNDLPMLEVVQCGYLLGSQVSDAEAPPGIVRIPNAGPDGFVAALRRFVASEDWA